MGHQQRFRPQVLATAAEAMRRRVDGKLHFDRVVVDVVDGRYVATGVRSQESNALAASAAANALGAAARRRRRRRGRRRHRHAPRLTRPRAVLSRERTSARGRSPGRSSPARPRRAAPPPRTRGSPDRTIQRLTVQPPGMSGCSPAGIFATKSDEVCTSPWVTVPLLHSTTAVRDGSSVDPVAAATPPSDAPTAMRRAPRSPRGFANGDHGSCSHCMPSRVYPFRKQTTGPPNSHWGGAGFALAPRKLKRPIRRLRINASP